VTPIGLVLAGDAPGRETDGEITAFDSTGLAIQDLAIARAALASGIGAELPQLDL
jgi:ornithine cyclodeaminase/alanine dehydrogenase-like protein (mu-crystallin family)